MAPEPWYFYVDRELAVTTWVVFLFRVVRFRWGALSGVPPRYSACPARPLYGWARSKYSPNCLDIAVVLWPCNLTTYAKEVVRQVDVPGPGVRRDTLWGSPLVGPSSVELASIDLNP